MGPFKTEAALGVTRAILMPPLDGARASPPGAVAAANAFTGVVIANGAHLMIPPALGFAIASAKARACLHPVGIGAAVLSRLRGHHGQGKGGPTQQQRHQPVHGIQPESHRLISQALRGEGTN